MSLGLWTFFISYLIAVPLGVAKAVTNVGSGDHLGLNYITTVQDLAVLKRVIVQNVPPTGVAVLNAADPNVAEMASKCQGAVTFFALDKFHPVMATHRARGQSVVYIENGAIAAAWALGLDGPTASGKSAAALAIAQELDCEIVSVDSALVYRGMDISTAKPTRTERAQVAHHLIDIRAPLRSYSAADFVRDARAHILAIHARRAGASGPRNSRAPGTAG